MPDTPIESIEFPNTYKILSFHSIPNYSNPMGGSEIIKQVLNVSASVQRDVFFVNQCMQGNIPDWMREFKPITLSDNKNSLTYYVSPDVLCIGNNDDFVRISLGGHAVRTLLDKFNCFLPTKQISDQIWKSADLKLNPKTMGASPNMTSTKTLFDHNVEIENERADRNFNIITGIKKDIVFTKHLLLDKTRISIYGWHYKTGAAIQGPYPNSSGHSIDYQDYSHSIRLVSSHCILNGNINNMYNILKDPSTAYLISHEGSFDATHIYK